MEMAARKSIDKKTPAQSSLLIGFSHVRWNFVHQRPQHILTLASRQHSVIYMEEPIFEEGPQPTVRVSDATPGIKIVTPVLAPGTSATKADAIQRRLSIRSSPRRRMAG